MDDVMTFNFSKVVFGTQLDLALVGQAALDGFLSPGSDESLTNVGRKMRNKQEALALLVLFDKVVLPDLSGINCEIPILEREGILQVHRDEHPLVRDFVESDWYRKRDPNIFTRVLDRTVNVRPLVLEYLARRGRSEFVDTLARTLGSTRKEAFNSLIDFAHSHYLGDQGRLKSNLIVQTLPPDLVKEFRKGLAANHRETALTPLTQSSLGLLTRVHFWSIMFGSQIRLGPVLRLASSQGRVSYGTSILKFRPPSKAWPKRSALFALLCMRRAPFSQGLKVSSMP
jgi:hypothetical protein